MIMETCTACRGVGDCRCHRFVCTICSHNWPWEFKDHETDGHICIDCADGGHNG
jgi:hypothetical protein